MKAPACARPQQARRRALQWLACAGVAPALVGCGEPEAPLNVGTIIFPGYEFLFLARAKGWLEQSQVRLVELLSSTDTLRALGDGKLEAATLTLDEVMSARAEDVDLRVVAVLDVSAGADALMVDPRIESLAQLKGRRIGVEDSAMGVVMFDAVLAAARLRLEDVVKVPYTAERSVGMLQSRQIDAAVTFEPWVGQLEALGARRLFDSLSIPYRIVDVLAVRADVMQSRPQAVSAMVAAHFRALQWWKQQPGEAARLMAPRLQVDPLTLGQAFRGLDLADLAMNRRFLQPQGVIAASAQAIQSLLVQRRVLREAVPVQGLLDARFLPAA